MRFEFSSSLTAHLETKASKPVSGSLVKDIAALPAPNGKALNNRAIYLDEKKDVVEEGQPAETPEAGLEYIGRVPTPRGNQVFGVIESRLGFGKMRVVCSDKKVRICRVPGKYKRRIWLKDGDIVMVEPWEFEGDKKGNILAKYRPAQVGWLRSKGLLKDLGI